MRKFIAKLLLACARNYAFTGATIAIAIIVVVYHDPQQARYVIFGMPLLAIPGVGFCMFLSMISGRILFEYILKNWFRIYGMTIAWVFPAGMSPVETNFADFRDKWWSELSQVSDMWEWVAIETSTGKTLLIDIPFGWMVLCLFAFVLIVCPLMLFWNTYQEQRKGEMWARTCKPIPEIIEKT